MAFLFKLETSDGKPADPPTLSTAVRTGGPATRSRSADARSASPTLAQTTTTRNTSWSSRRSSVRRPATRPSGC
jgi:hypothetical protein